MDIKQQFGRTKLVLQHERKELQCQTQFRLLWNNHETRCRQFERVGCSQPPNIQYYSCMCELSLWLHSTHCSNNPYQYKDHSHNSVRSTRLGNRKLRPFLHVHNSFRSDTTNFHKRRFRNAGPSSLVDNHRHLHCYPNPEHMLLHFDKQIDHCRDYLNDKFSIKSLQK